MVTKIITIVITKITVTMACINRRSAHVPEVESRVGSQKEGSSDVSTSSGTGPGVSSPLASCCCRLLTSLLSSVGVGG